MHQTTSSLIKAYSSLLNEVSLPNLQIEGDIPAWLSGYFISNGPAQFEIGETKFNHWLDGFAMLKQFKFCNGAVSFNNRFLLSKQYENSLADNKLYFNEFGTYANNNRFMRFAHSISSIIKGEIYDNCNVNTNKIADQYIAMTEANLKLAFDVKTLKTLEKFQFSEPAQGKMSLAHPQLDIVSEDLFNITTEIGKTVKYHIYKTEKGSKRQTLINTYITDELFYMHSFSLTENYIILFKSPLIGNKFKLFFSYPFNDSLAWDKNESSFFVIINRQNGTIKEIETEPFIALHSVNAFELDDEIILDLICHYEGNPYDRLYLSNLTSKKPIFNKINLKRYTLDIQKKLVVQTILLDSRVEFPQINYNHCNGVKYQFAYMALMTDPHQLTFNAIQKINVNTGATQCWKKSEYYPGEPLFIQKPNTVIEDEGILLFIAFNAKNSLSSLIILDAKDMQQLAEIFLPFHLPFGLHGKFYTTIPNTLEAR